MGLALGRVRGKPPARRACNTPEMPADRAESVLRGELEGHTARSKVVQQKTTSPARSVPNLPIFMDFLVVASLFGDATQRHNTRTSTTKVVQKCIRIHVFVTVESTYKSTRRVSARLRRDRDCRRDAGKHSQKAPKYGRRNRQEPVGL